METTITTTTTTTALIFLPHPSNSMLSFPNQPHLCLFDFPKTPSSCLLQRTTLCVRVHHLRKARTTTLFTTKWDPNAEGRKGSSRFGFSPKMGRKKKRRWWYDGGGGGDEEDYDEEDEEDEEGEELGFFEQVVDSIWILKVFGSYGWFLPAIILSLLLASGPKALLTTSAISLGLSVVILVFSKLQGGRRSRSKRKVSRKRRRSAFRASNIRMKAKRDKSKESRMARGGYRSWVIENENSDHENAENKTAFDGRSANGFGGWDELDRVQYGGTSPPSSNVSRKQMENGKWRENLGSEDTPLWDELDTAQSGGTSLPSSDVSRKQMENSKWSKDLISEDAPLLLRLLIAMFPFLSSWTKMFW